MPLSPRTPAFAHNKRRNQAHLIRQHDFRGSTDEYPRLLECKHISQTYEDFDDISLSIKPEDVGRRGLVRRRFLGGG